MLNWVVFPEMVVVMTRLQMVCVGGMWGCGVLVFATRCFVL